MGRFRDRLHFRSRKKNLEQPAKVHSGQDVVPISNEPITASKTDLPSPKADDHVSSSDDLPPTTPSQVTETANSIHALWTSAYRNLKDQDPELTREFERCLGLTTDEDITDAEFNDVTKRALRELEKFEEVKEDKLSKTKASIRKYFEQTVKVVSASNAFISAAISSNPYAALAWTGVSLLLPLVLSPTEENEAAIQGLEYVANLIVVYRWYEKSYLQGGETSDFKNLTIRLYTLLLEYEATLLVYKHRNAPKRWAKDVFAAGDWSSQTSKIKGVDAHCRAVINAISDARTKEWRDEERKWQAQLLQQPRQDEERRNIRKLYLNYEADKNVNPERIPGTCEWFLNHPGFLTWRESQKSSMLWLSADPGCGKSVLSKYLVDRRGEVMTINPDAPGLCYFFFKDGDLDRMDAAKALCAILHQLFMQEPRLYQHAKEDFEIKNDKFLTDLDALWDVFMRAVEDSPNREIICVLDALDECQEQSRKALISKLTRLYSPHRSAAIGLTVMKFFVTSRPDFGIVRDFKDVTSVLSEIRLRGEEESEQISKEIDLVIRHKTKDLALRMDLHKRYEKQLLKNLSSIPHRTYLWLYLTFDAIEGKLEITKKDIKVIAETVPKSVDEAYTNILEKSQDRERARKLLHIILAAKQPLTLQEINVAMVINENHKSYKNLKTWPSSVAPDIIKNICGLFVSVVDSKVYLIHQTAREFLLSEESGNPSMSPEGWRKSFQLAQSNLVLARISIQYLGLDDFLKGWSQFRQALARSADSDSSTEDDNFGKEEFSDEHSDKTNLNCERSMEDRTKRVLSKENVLRMERLEIAEIGGEDESEDETNWEWESISKDDKEDDKDMSQIQANVLFARDDASIARDDVSIARDDASIAGDDFSIDYLLIEKLKNDYVFLSYASQFWAAHLTQAGSLAKPALIESVAYKTYKTSSKSFRLWYSIWYTGDDNYVDTYPHVGPNIIPASRFGHLEVVRLLLEREGTQNDAVDGQGRSPLLLAAGQGHEGLVNLLLHWGASIEWKDKSQYTALHWAVHGGHTSVIKVLLDRGAPINAMDGNGDTPLLNAINYEKVAVVQLLIAHGANTILRDAIGRTPLCVAASYGDASIVELLLDKGVQVDPRDISDQTPLFIAAEEGHDEVIRTLLEMGASVNFSGEDGKTSLAIAARFKYTKCAQILLEHGARVDSKDKTGKTPLFEAVYFNSEDMVELLLERGARIDSKDKTGCTPLSEAASHDNKGIVELLLERATRVDFKDKNGRTPLSEAASHGHGANVELLFDRGARVDSKDKTGRTPLFEAVCGGSEGMVEMLLERGAQIDSKDKTGWTPLFMAACIGKEGIAELLLNHGAQVDLRDKQNRSPLWWASAGGHNDVIKIFLKRGAEVDSRDRRGQTALWIASTNTYGKVSVKLLLDHGAQIDSKDKKKRTPLWMASMYGCVRTLKLLLAQGAQVDARDQKGRTPLWIAVKRGLKQIIKLLLKRGARTDLIWRVLSSSKKHQQPVTKLTLKRRARIKHAWRVLVLKRGQKRRRSHKRVVRTLEQRIQCLGELDY